MELRERVARAICSISVEQHNVEERWIDYVDDADAAIAAVLDAMREPSEGMAETGADAVDAVELAMVLRDASAHPESMPDLDSGDMAKAAYSAMLAAFRTEALGEG